MYFTISLDVPQPPPYPSIWLFFPRVDSHWAYSREPKRWNAGEGNCHFRALKGGISGDALQGASRGLTLVCKKQANSIQAEFQLPTARCTACPLLIEVFVPMSSVDIPDSLFANAKEFTITSGVFNNIRGNQINNTIVTSANPGQWSPVAPPNKTLATSLLVDYALFMSRSDEEVPVVRAKSLSYITAVFTYSHGLSSNCTDSSQSDYT